LSLAELSQYLSTHYNTQAERDRNARHRLRDELYADGGVKYMCSVIDKVFEDPKVRELRKQWVPFARFNNVMKRIVSDCSTVYQAPATRAVDGEDENAKYQALLTELRFDEYMAQVDRMLTLHQAVLVGFRVRELPDGTREPVVDIATPSIVRAITHPTDTKLVVGWMIRVEYKTHRTNLLRAPAWIVWTDHERFHLDEQCHVIESTYVEHELGICPWVPVTAAVDQAGFFPGEAGEDLVAAQVAIWMANVLLLKESKSATKQPMISGDTSAMAKNQIADTEVPIVAPDGVSITTIDMSMDTTMFTRAADHVLERLANNYGMSLAMVTHQGVQSAEARRLMAEPLKALRAQRHRFLRPFEKRFAIVQSKVLAKDDPARAFDPAGWREDFGEALVTPSETEKLAVFEKKRGMGLDNSIAYLMRDNPDLTFEQAAAIVIENIDVETWRNRQMRPLQQISGSLGAALPSGGGEGGTSGSPAALPPANDNQPPIDGGDTANPPPPAA
jgi:hypothetical protein